MSLQELKQLEHKLDDEVASLEIWKLPARVILLALHNGLYNFVRNDREKAITIAGRMSHLLDFLAKCPSIPAGENALEAFNAYTMVDQQLQQMMLAINYGHFAEVMPQVHRGFYTVTKVADKHFHLEYASQGVAKAEARDVVLSELAMPHVIAPPPDVQDEVRKLAAMAPEVDLKLMSRVLGTYIDHYLKHIVEPALLSDETLMAAFGVSNAELSRFTAILLAIASYAVDISRAIEPLARTAVESGIDTASEVEAEWLEWISVFWKEDFLRHLLRVVTTDSAKLDALLSIFALNFRVSPAQTGHGGDGYFPPLALLPDSSVVIGPYFTMFFAHTRNLLYALPHLDRTKFDEVVSEGLEPQLLLHAQMLLKRQSGIDVEPNVVWSAEGIKGEIDLLIYEEASNTALQIQAKAPIAPYGARMVARLEGRIIEGVRQLNDFRSLPQGQIDAIISKAIRKQVTGVHLEHAVLARSCFGSQRTWGANDGVCFLSLAVLSELTKPQRLFSLADLTSDAEAYLDTVTERANPTWSHKPLQVGEWLLDVPMLDLDQSYLDLERIRVWA